MNKKTVAICVPSGRQVEADMAISLAGLAAFSAEHYRLGTFNEKSSVVSRARERLVERSLATIQPDLIMFIDSDLRFPPHAMKTLIDQATSGRDIVCATYKKRAPPFEILGQLKNEKVDLFTDGFLQETLFMPGGFMLIKAAVFRKLSHPWFFETYDEPNIAGGYMSEDYNFCRKARANGFSIWCDLKLSEQIGHVGEQVITMELPKPPQSPIILPNLPKANGALHV